MIDPRPRTPYVRLETAGRKSGLPHIVELRYAVIEGSFFLLPGEKGSDWLLNAIHSGKARVRTNEAVFEAVVRIATESEKLAVEQQFARKYGRQVVYGWYRNPPLCLCLTPTEPPRLRRGTAGEHETQSSYSHWARKKLDYYSEVGMAFDLASEEYDFTISHNFINTWIRRRSIEIVREYVRPDDILLEIGCGTGVETIQIANLVKGIVATDLSQRMVDQLSAKVRAKHLEAKIVPLRLSAVEAPKAVSSTGGEKIRVAYSFNGALNCEPRLRMFAENLHSVLEPSGYFLCSVRNTLCLTEMLSHAFVLQFGRATPRKKQPSMVSVGGSDIPSTYYSVARFEEFFKPYFKPVKVIALPGLLPPAYLNSYYLRFRRNLPLLERLDRILSDHYPLNNLGDQTFFVFQKIGK